MARTLKRLAVIALVERLAKLNDCADYTLVSLFCRLAEFSAFAASAVDFAVRRDVREPKCVCGIRFGQCGCTSYCLILLCSLHERLPILTSPAAIAEKQVQLMRVKTEDNRLPPPNFFMLNLFRDQAQTMRDAQARRDKPLNSAIRGSRMFSSRAHVHSSAGQVIGALATADVLLALVGIKIDEQSQDDWAGVSARQSIARFDVAPSRRFPTRRATGTRCPPQRKQAGQDRCVG